MNEDDVVKMLKQVAVANKDPRIADDRGQMGLIRRCWREADVMEKQRIENRTKGFTDSDLEVPMLRRTCTVPLEQSLH